MPQPGLGKDLSLKHALEIDTYDMYCGYTSSLVAVDILKAVKEPCKTLHARQSLLSRSFGWTGT